MYVRIYVCVQVYMYVCICAPHMYVCMHAYFYVCTYVCTYICLYELMNVCTRMFL